MFFITVIIVFNGQKFLPSPTSRLSPGMCRVHLFLKNLIIAKQFIIYVMLCVMFIVQDIHATSIQKLYVMNYSSLHIFVTSVATQPIAQ